MYSPKIAEGLIPALYHTAKAKRMPMTRLVEILIRKALAAEDMPQAAMDVLSDPHSRGSSQAAA